MGPTFADDAHRYRLDSRIATGGMGVVWRGTDTVLGREVAVKVLKHEYADDPAFRTRFETEARNAAALHHPGVAGVYDFGEAAAPDSPVGSGAQRPYLVMELVEGEPLSRLLADGRDLDPDAVRDLLAQAGDALAAAHRAGIVHRDVKPANLMVTPGGRLKVTDFGIARAADGVGITQTGTVMGTAQYLSPEQARGERATPASDVYSLGVVAFECLAGRRPFEAESQVATALAHIQQPVPDLPAAVPADLAAVVRKALAKDPADRFRDGAAFAAAVRSRAHPVTEATQVFPATVSQPVPPPYPPPAERTPDRRRARWLVPLVVLLLVAAIVVAAIALTGGDDDTDVPPADDTTQTPTTEPTPDEPTDTPTPTPTPTPSDTPTEPTTPPTTQTTPPTETTEPTTPTSEPPTSPTTGLPTNTEGEGN
jgi:serine/threonine-protein kinase